MIGARPIGALPLGAGTFSANASPLTIIVGGVDVSAWYQPGSLEITESLGQRAAAGWMMVDPAGAAISGPARATTLTVAPLDEVRVVNAWGLLFAGFVHTVEERVPGASDALFLSVECVDYAAIADRRLVNAVFDDPDQTSPSQTMGDIVRDLWSRYLEPEGVTLGTVADGPIVASFTSSYLTVTQALDELMKAAAGTYVWQIDYAKQLLCYDRQAFSAPISLTDVNNPVRSITRARSLAGYRNRQHLRAGHDKSTARTELFESDGKQRTFAVSLPIAEKPTITLDSVPVAATDIGIDGVDDADWLYQVGERAVTVNTDQATVPTAGVDISITYQGFYPLVMVVEDSAEVAIRKAQGGTGLFEAVSDADGVDSAERARDVAESLLAERGQIPERVEAVLDVAGFRAGQLLSVALTAHDLNGTYLVDSCSLQDIGGEEGDTYLRARISATDATELVESLRFWRDLVLAGRALSIRENETVIAPATQRGTIDIADARTADSSDTVDVYTLDPYTVLLIGSDSRLAVLVSDEATSRYMGPRLGLPDHMEQSAIASTATGAGAALGATAV